MGPVEGASPKQERRRRSATPVARQGVSLSNGGVVHNRTLDAALTLAVALQNQQQNQQLQTLAQASQSLSAAGNQRLISKQPAPGTVQTTMMPGTATNADSGAAQQHR